MLRSCALRLVCACALRLASPQDTRRLAPPVCMLLLLLGSAPAMAQSSTTTLAGSTGGNTPGVGVAARFSAPGGVSLSPSGDFALVADTNNNNIKRIDLATSAVTILVGDTAGLAGNGHVDRRVGTNAKFDTPSGVCISNDGHTAFVTEDEVNSIIRKIDMATATVTYVAGGGTPDTTLTFPNDGTGAPPNFRVPSPLAPCHPPIPPAIPPERCRCHARMSQGYGARVSYPKGCTATPDGSTLYFVEGSTSNGYVRKIDTSTREVTTVCGGGGASAAHLIGTGTPPLMQYGTDEGYAGEHASFDKPWALALSPDATMAYVVDKGVHRIRQVTLATGMVTTLVGSTQGYANGVGTNALFYDPEGIAYGPGGILYVADSRNYRIRKIDIATRTVATLVGAGTLGNDDGTSAVATFRQPTGISVTADGMRMLVSDASSHLIRQVLPLGAAAAAAAVQSPPPPSPPPPLPLRFLRQNTRPGRIDGDNGGQMVSGSWGLLRTGALHSPFVLMICLYAHDPPHATPRSSHVHLRWISLVFVLEHGSHRLDPP